MDLLKEEKKKSQNEKRKNHIKKIRPRNFLEIGIFHGVTSRNVCELLHELHGNKFKFTGIDLFENDTGKLDEEIAPNIHF